MVIRRWLKDAWNSSLLRAYLALEFAGISSLKTRLKIAWFVSILVSSVVGVSLIIIFYESGVRGLLLCIVSSYALYFVLMHLLVISKIKEVNGFIVSEEHPINLEKYTHRTTCQKSGDKDLDRYLARYFQARQFSIFILSGGAFCVALILALYFVVAASL